MVLNTVNTSNASEPSPTVTVRSHFITRSFYLTSSLFHQGKRPRLDAEMVDSDLEEFFDKASKASKDAPDPAEPAQRAPVKVCSLFICNRID